jgi:hypothetical protein
MFRRTPKGCRRLFKQFSFPGDMPSHVAPDALGSIHEGGDSVTPYRMLLALPSVTGILLSPV